MKRISILSICVLFSFLVSVQSLLAQSKAQQIDQYLTKATKEGFSGVALVAHKGKIIFTKGYGLANREKGIAFDKNSVFDIGSITKQFTGAAILKLEMEGKLKTTDLLSKYITDLPQDKQKITLHHLLTHSAGLPSGIGPDDELISKKDYLQRVYKKKTRKSFGSNSYSNVGYSLLAIVVEKASGMSYEEYLNKKIFKPAGMTQTGYVLPKWKEKNIVIAYKDNRRWGATHRKSQYHKGVTYHLRGNGGIMSTVLDMHKWYVAIQNNTVLSKAATQKYISKQIQEGSSGRFHYGYGWSIEKKPGREIVWHNGGNGFFNDYMGFYPEKDLMLMVACNFGRDSDGYAHKIDEIMHGEFKSLDESIANQYAGTYQLPSGQKFTVSINANNQLVVPINYAQLYTTFSGTPKDDPKIAKGYNQKIQEMMNTLLTKDYAGFAKIERRYISSMSEAEIERQIKAGFENMLQMMGKLKSVEILGSVARREGKYYLTASKLVFEKGNSYFFNYWKGNTLIDFSRSSEGEMTKRFNHKKGKTFFANSNQLSIHLTTKDGVPALKVGDRLVVKKVGDLK